METPADHQWFLRKHEDGSIFGPLTFEQLAHWASSAQVAPHDSISTDQLTWMKAPMLPELEMDWIAEITSERLYGPTTLGAIRDFVQIGEIDEDTFVINTSNATRVRVRDIDVSLKPVPAGGRQEPQELSGAILSAGGAGLFPAAEDRIHELEQALREERRALTEAEERCRALEAKCSEMLAERTIL